MSMHVFEVVYEGVSKSFWTVHLERELQIVSMFCDSV